MSETNNTKKCSKCGRILPVDNFSKYNKAKDGLQGYCRECSSKYHQTYEQTNKEYLKRYKKEYRQTNKEHISRYQRQYYQTNKEHCSQYQKEYYNQFKGYYLYIIQDKNNNIVYVGQTCNYYNRLCRHLSGYVDSTKDLFTSGDWGCIKYLDVTDLVANDMELKALENELIELYEPRCNTLLNIIRDIDRDRLFSLLAQLHGILNEWIVFKENV